MQTSQWPVRGGLGLHPDGGQQRESFGEYAVDLLVPKPINTTNPVQDRSDPA
jgi:hypothetical protein